MSLADLLIARIRETGPLTIADYMTECLLHPRYGYYTTRDPFGAKGDFTTAPEISQMFGELIGLALAQAWMDQGAPRPFTLAELGPGRGTLMADILRATASVPGFYDACEIALVEASPSLRERQEATLKGYDINWLEQISDLPDGPLFVVANEFFDALPIRQFLRDEDTWRERQVGMKDGALAFGLGGPTEQPALAAWSDVSLGTLIELRPAANAVIAELAAMIAEHGGAALIVDYGSWGEPGDTFQALRAHEKVDPLATPGAADLTAHVDFAALAKAASAVSHGFATQGVFLERLGITARAQALASKLTGEPLTSHIAAHRRLTHPVEMGELFKVLGLVAPGAPMLPGFDP